jgi:hypothetical protein
MYFESEIVLGRTARRPGGIVESTNRPRMWAMAAIAGCSFGVAPGAALAQAGCDDWRALPGFAGGNVWALVEFNGDLIAGGAFRPGAGNPGERIARWDGSAWGPLGAGLNAKVGALAVYNGQLIAGGEFTAEQGGVAGTLSRVAAWNGTAWQPVGGGVDNTVTVLHVHAGKLYVGGIFEYAGGGTVWANKIASWDGTDWGVLGWGVDQTGVSVNALTTYDDDLFMGGLFTEVSGVDIRRVARWDGQIWHPLQGGNVGGAGFVGVLALAAHDGELIAAGGFSTAGGQPADRIAAWNGSTWRALGETHHQINALTVYNGQIVMGTTMSWDPVNFPLGYPGVMAWDGTNWTAPGGGITAPFASVVQTLAVYGGELIAAGNFTEAGGVPAQRVAAYLGCATCYANCDESTTPPILNVEDFTCFISQFALAMQITDPQQQITHYANCDNSTTEPVLNVEDFICFISAFAQGCP